MPKTFGRLTVGIKVLFMCKLSCLSNPVGSRVNKVEVDLFAFSYFQLSSRVN